MISKSWKRSASAIAAGALLIAGATSAQAISNDQIDSSTNNNYEGWHQGHPGGDDNFSADWDGLHLGLGGPSQVIKGLVEEGQIPAETVSAQDLERIIRNSGFYRPTGEVFFQIGIFFTNDDGEDQWSTLRPNTPADTSGDFGWVTLGQDDWRGTEDLAHIPPQPIRDFLVATNSDEFKIASFGVYADTPSSIEAILFDREDEFFTFEGEAKYDLLEEVTAGTIDDLIVADGTEAAQTCEGVEFSGDGSAAVRYSAEPIEVVGETIEERWSDLLALLIYQVEWKYTVGSAPAVDVPLHIAYGETLETSTEISVTEDEEGEEADFIFEGNLDGFTSGESVDIRDIAQALVESGNVWLTGLTVETDGAPTILTDIQFSNSVNLSFEGDCTEEEPGEEKPELEDGNKGEDGPKDEPADKPGNDDDDAAKPVVADPKYAG